MVLNGWLLAATVLAVGLIPCGIVCMRSRPMDRVVALILGGTVDALLLLLLAEAFSYDPLYDLALAVSLLTLAGGLVFAHFLERWT